MGVAGNQIATGLNGNRGHLSAALATAVIFALCAYLLNIASLNDGQLAGLWIANAIVIGLLFGKPRTFVVSCLLACVLSGTVANLAAVAMPVVALGLALANVLEMAIVLIALELVFKNRDPLAKQSDLAVLALLGAVCPIVPGFLASAILSFQGSVGYLDAFATWLVGHCMAIPVFTAMVLALRGFGSHPSEPVISISNKALLGLSLLVAVVLIFGQRSYPFLFLALPVILLAAFTTGRSGTALAVAVFSAAAAIAYARDQGPLAPVEGPERVDLITLQAFMAACLSVGLPVAIALANRAVIRRELSSSEARFRRLAEASPVGIFQADAEGDLTYVNSAWLKQFGFESEEILGAGWKRLLASGEEFEDDPAFTGFHKPGDVRHRILRFRDAEGRAFWCETVNSAEFDPDGRICGFVGVAHDITEQRAAMELLVESEKRFAALADMAPAGIFRTTPDGSCNYVNERWKALTGLKDDEWEGEGWASALHPDDLERVIDIWSACVEAGKSGDAEFRWLRADGTVVWVHVVFGPEVDSRGNVTSFIGVVSDITERHIARKQIADREAQLALLADNATDAVVRLDLTGRCTYASPSATNVFEVPHERLIGHKLITRLHREEERAVKEAFQRLREGQSDKERLAFRAESLVRPGEFNWLEANCGLLRDPTTSDPCGIIASLRNVDGTKRLEAELVEAKAEAEAAAEAKSAFLANMSHEIRTPMNGVIGFTELALANELSDEVRGQIEMIADSGRAMLRLLNDLLDLAKIESGQMAIISEPVDLRNKLDGIVQLMRPVAQQKGLHLDLAVAEAVPEWLLSDAMRLRQIVLNLVGNAVKFTERGSVRVAANTVDNPGVRRLQIAVTDTGIGIPEQSVGLVFEKFSQADASIARRFGGTGLGLPISRQLAEKMGGALSVQSKEGEGTTFLLDLPLEQCAPPLVTADHVSPAGPSRRIPRQARILVADDNPINQALTLGMLRQAGFEGEVASNGRDAVSKVIEARGQRQDFDMVLMDVQMPELDGLEATRRLRSVGFTPESLPIVALTANAYADDIKACLASGMQGHIAKPVRLRDLRSALECHLRSNDESEDSTDDPLVNGRLAAMYRERKQQVLNAIDEALREGKLEGRSIEEVAGLLHQIAGIAAYFGEEGLGEASLGAEERLPTLSIEEKRRLLREMRDLLAA
ncbi:PAS domain S-box protein [Tsuneonella sp. SYSU-LHT278]|uniref:PAS domain S-box protein n=1 Tax=Tsuneonella sediminis TaxID=3416089 RepID=UPI003F78D7B9